MTDRERTRVFHPGERPRDEDESIAVEPVPGLEPHVCTRFGDLRKPGAYLGNGVIGLRLPPVPFRHAEAAVSGYVGRSIAEAHESQAPAPNPLGADLVAGAARLSEAYDRIELEEQRLDMATAELTTRLRFHGTAGAVRIEAVTFLPRQMPSLACQELTVTAESASPVILEAVMDPRGLPGACRERFMLGHDLDSVLWWASRGGLATVGAGFATELRDAEAEGSRQNDWGNESELCLRQYRVNLEAGRSCRLWQYGALVPDALQPEPHVQVFHLLRFAQKIGFPRLRREHRAHWRELWRARPLIHGPGAAHQAYADSAFFYLHSSIHRSTPAGLAPFGLSRTEGYYDGHTFTSDADFYMLPGLFLTDPDAAGAFMGYRYGQLDDARGFARMLGYDGAFFPNQTGRWGSNASRPSAGQAIDGSSFKSHFVAEAFLQYACATGDEDFLRERAWPVVRDTADWIVSRVTRTSRGYEVRNLQITHQYANTHNEPPVNRAFRDLLQRACALAERVGRTPKRAWRRVAEGIVILTDEADLRRETAWFAPTYKAFERAADREEVIAEMEQMSGVPISSIRPVRTALTLGHRDLAARWWPYEVGLHYEADRFGLWTERTGMWKEASHVPPGEQACFITFPGHVLKQLLVEFPRLDLVSEDVGAWPARPATLPDGWDAIEVERVWVQGEAKRMVAPHGELTRFEPIGA